ncbi:hypothetical protein I4U23_015279 [Adineta vaga]|nr:hypothetical protein I4U23_015279 [Adineta vaga]
MGAGPSDHQQDSIMIHNAQHANHFAKEHQNNKRNYEASIEQMGKLLNFQKTPVDNKAGGTNDLKQIEIDGVQYQLIQFINRGGFGQVYKAQDRRRNRIVAIKIMNNIPGIQEEIKSEIHFLRLIKSIDIDNHPVIEYYGCKFTKENICIAMELAATDLLTFWFNNAAHREAQQKFLFGIIIIVYVLRALIFLEKLNIIHGDIKPQNLVIVQSHQQHFFVKLIDFGTVEKMNTKSPQITVDVNKAHTVYFASPEFLRRNSRNIMSRHLHKKSDAWAAGVMFYVLFFEKFPWKNEADYDSFCNNPHARDIIVPREGGYKAIIELLLKKNPDERASAKSTYLQMKGHPSLGAIVKIFHENFCSVDDVCYLKVSDDVRHELSKLPRSASSSSSSTTMATTTLCMYSSHFVKDKYEVLFHSIVGSRRPCRYGRECYNVESDHRREFIHSGDSDFHIGLGNSQFEKAKCRYGSDCFRHDFEHRKKYSHPEESRHDLSRKIPCRYGKGCYDKAPDHMRKYSHPDDFMKEKCRYGNHCYKMTDPEHIRKYWH